MMIGMTKPLRRFRATRAAEDGELTDSDGEEEEGQIKLEKGDDVALVAEAGLYYFICLPVGCGKQWLAFNSIILHRLTFRISRVLLQCSYMCGEGSMEHFVVCSVA
ncbi:unnamed protein product [Haemonchus placei]|uniref:Uncharacterized protein n=1 Tax=Haemonchus placei TaxID=6290 RepID=A0A0N4WHG2_HAEPC|nr:unnamed protein product [Haemonchus placei]